MNGGLPVTCAMLSLLTLLTGLLAVTRAMLITSTLLGLAAIVIILVIDLRRE